MHTTSFWYVKIDGLLQICSNSIANAQICKICKFWNETCQVSFQNLQILHIHNRLNIQFRNRLHQHQLAKLTVLLTLGHWGIEYVKPWLTLLALTVWQIHLNGSFTVLPIIIIGKDIPGGLVMNGEIHYCQTTCKISKQYELRQMTLCLKIFLYGFAEKTLLFHSQVTIEAHIISSDAQMQ